jgi:hypothetical protein
MVRPASAWFVSFGTGPLRLESHRVFLGTMRTYLVRPALLPGSLCIVQRKDRAGAENRSKTNMTRNMWGQVRERLLSEIGQNHYRNWIEPLELNGLEDGVATFVVPTNFVGNWVQRNYGDRIMRHMSAFEPVTRLEFTVAPAARVPAGPKPADAAADEVAQAVGTQVKWESEELPGAPLDPRFTFDTFVVGKPNELAHAAARRVAEGGPVTFNPLFLYGGVGLGKTHLMHAIAWEIRPQPQPQGALSLRRAVHVPLRAGAARADDGFQAPVPLGRRADGR